MSGPLITLEALFTAFSLPPGGAPRRVPKVTLSDNVPTSADRKLIDGKLARLEWLAGINHASTGIPSGLTEGLMIDTVNVLGARTRGLMPPRLAEIIHRAIPKPVILLHQDEASRAGAALSLAPKRAAERELSRVVTTMLLDTGPLNECHRHFVNELALAGLPTRDLGSLYAGLTERVEALSTARAVGRSFRLACSAAESAQWRHALEEVRTVRTEMARVSAAMRKESRLSAKVELGEGVRQMKLRLDELQILLK